MMVLCMSINAQAPFKDLVYEWFHPKNHHCSGVPGPDSSTVIGDPPGAPGHEPLTNHTYTVIVRVGGNPCNDSIAFDDSIYFETQKEIYNSASDSSNIVIEGEVVHCFKKLEHVRVIYGKDQETHTDSLGRFAIKLDSLNQPIDFIAFRYKYKRVYVTRSSFLKVNLRKHYRREKKGKTVYWGNP